MKRLLLDIETAPNIGAVWGLFDQNISPQHLLASSYILCWSAKWYDEKELKFSSVQRSTSASMLHRIHTLLDQADVVVHFNGRKFDIPVLNKEFIKAGLTPPAPYQQVDLYQVCKHAFKFESNKMDYVLKTLGIGEKLRHEGFELWLKCMGLRDYSKREVAEAWRKMEAYNRRDVTELEKLYTQLLPWIDRHPTHGAHSDDKCCPKCGGTELIRRGWAYTTTMKYPRYQCKACGGWARGNKSVSVRRSERLVNVAH